jgi:hypothetical protein
MMLKNFKWFKKVVLIPVAAALLANYGPLDGQQAPRGEYRALGNANAKGGGGKITKGQSEAPAGFRVEPTWPGAWLTSYIPS